ncbi:hypothetical protein YC2023_081850 [Brassica napus]
MSSICAYSQWLSQGFKILSNLTALANGFVAHEIKVTQALLSTEPALDGWTQAKEAWASGHQVMFDKCAFSVVVK